MAEFLEPLRPWIESVLDAPFAEAMTFEIDLPFGQVVAEDCLAGVVLDRECLERADALLPPIERWRLPDGVSRRVALAPSRDWRQLVTARELAWDPHWKDTAIAVWLRGLGHPVIAVTIPYMSYQQGLVSDVRSWLLARRDEAAAALDRLRVALDERHKAIEMIGGEPVPLLRLGRRRPRPRAAPTAARRLRGVPGPGGVVPPPSVALPARVPPARAARQWQDELHPDHGVPSEHHGPQPELLGRDPEQRGADRAFRGRRVDSALARDLRGPRPPVRQRSQR